MIKIVDYDAGNIASIANMLNRLGADSVIVSKPAELIAGDKVILPGVGAFDTGARNLTERGLRAAITELANAGTIQVLGICLGMQLLFDRSEEGVLPGLGLIGGSVARFRFESREFKVPHMGWNIVRPRRKSWLFGQDGSSEERFYFVHSYHAICNDQTDVAAETTYGYSFCCAVERGNVAGVQFHPEKSHRFGLSLLRRFVERTADAEE